MEARYKMCMEETRHKRFIIGITFIIASFILGKLVFIPLLIRPESSMWRTMVFVGYLGTWILLFLGIWLAGREGYAIVKEKYREQRQKTVSLVRDRSVRAARNIKEKTQRIKGRIRRKQEKETEHDT